MGQSLTLVSISDFNINKDVIIIVNLKPTLNPINAQERVKINENWDELRRYLSNIQTQINLLGGTDVSVIVDTINAAIIDSQVKTQEAIDNLDASYALKLIEIDNSLAELSTALTDTNTATQSANDARDAAILATTDARSAITELMTAISDFGSKGVWNNSTLYKRNNLVLVDGQTYIANQDNSNTEVTDTSTWTLFASRGEQGIQGVEGPRGLQGPQGVPGMNGTGSGTVTAINNVLPDGTGNVTITIPNSADFATKTELNNVVDRVEDHISSVKVDAHEISNINGLRVELDSKSTFSGDYLDLSNRPAVEDLATLNTIDKSSLVNAINEVNDKPSGGGTSYQLISSVDASNSVPIIAFNTAKAYDKLRIAIRDVASSAINVGLTLSVEGIAGNGTYSGYRVINTGITTQGTNAIISSGVSSGKDISGYIDIEYINERIYFEGVTLARTVANSTLDPQADFYKTTLRAVRDGISSVELGWTGVGLFVTGTIELWGVPK